jgi:hypothetical protein
MGTPSITAFGATATTDGGALYTNDAALAVEINGNLEKSTNVTEYKTKWSVTSWDTLVYEADLTDYYVIWFRQINATAPKLKLAETWLEGTAKGLGGTEVLGVTIQQGSSPTSGFANITPTSGTAAITISAEGTRYTRPYDTSIPENNYVRASVTVTNPTGSNEYGLYIRLVFEQDSEN